METPDHPRLITIYVKRDSGGEVFLSAEGIALLLGVDIEGFLAHAATNDYGSLTTAPQWIPEKWLKQGRQRAREAMAHTNDGSLQATLEYWAEKEHGAKLCLELRDDDVDDDLGAV